MKVIIDDSHIMNEKYMNMPIEKLEKLISKFEDNDRRKNEQRAKREARKAANAQA
jgi:hypothetical protein